GNSCEEPFGSHGTHVAGLATGRWVAHHLTCDDQREPRKPMSEAVDRHIELMVLKVTPVEGRDGDVVLPSALKPAIKYAIRNHADIINMSLAGPVRDSDELEDWVRFFQAYENVLFVVAAGNGKSGGKSASFDLEAQDSPQF